MKKLLIVILIIGGIFVSQDKKKYLEIMHEKIDIFVPKNIQGLFSNISTSIVSGYKSIETVAEQKRADLKEWSLSESDLLVKELSGSEYIRKDKSFSPILDNSNVVFSGESSVKQKLYGALLFVTTLLFWNFRIFAIWVCLILYVLVKKIKQTYFPKRKPSFFDRINEGVKKEMDSDWD